MTESKFTDLSTMLAKKVKSEDIKDKLLVVKTIQDGFTGIREGAHYYKVEEDSGDYTVSPVSWDDKTKKFVPTDKPVILTEGADTVLFVGNALKDPYVGTSVINKKLGKAETLENQVLQAFLASIDGIYSLGVYGVMISDEAGVIDAE